MSEKPHLIYTRSFIDWQNFITRYPIWKPSASHYPLLDTEALEVGGADYDFIRRADKIIFTSHHAVENLFDHIDMINIIQPDTQCIAIGERSAMALRAHIRDEQISTAPPPYNSEALLSVWQPKAESIAIIAAPGGRTLLRDCLQKHNQVRMVMAYRRFCVSHPTPIPFKVSAENIILIASGNGLCCLIENTPQKLLKLLQYQATLACISRRVANLAKKNGFQHVFNAEKASEDELIRTITTRQSPIRNFGVSR